MTRVPLQEVQGDLVRYIEDSADEDVVVTRDGRPAAVIIGFRDDDDWFDYNLEKDERFLARIEHSRRQAREGKYTRLEDLPD